MVRMGDSMFPSEFYVVFDGQSGGCAGLDELLSQTVAALAAFSIERNREEFQTTTPHQRELASGIPQALYEEPGLQAPHAKHMLFGLHKNL